MATKDDVAVMLPTPTTGKPTLHALKTPKSAGSFPSELPRSPYPGTPLFLKQEEINMRTPISPPTAYTEFLKAVSSPLVKSGKSTPTSTPSSETSGCSSCTCDHPPTSLSSASSSKSPVPPSPYTHPKSAPATGAVRRLRIPPSPLYSPGAPGATDSPGSALSMRSPFTIRSPFEWDAEAKRWSSEGSKSGAGMSRPVSVRHIITRTVTYTPRMDLAPAPKGKKRRLE